MNKITVQEYYKLLKSHDWYYEFSNSHLKWQKGKENETKLKNLGCFDIKLKKMYEDFVAYHNERIDGNLNIHQPKLENYL